MLTLTHTAGLSRETHVRLDAFLQQQRDLWNATLEERIGTCFDQCKGPTPSDVPMQPLWIRGRPGRECGEEYSFGRTCVRLAGREYPGTWGGCRTRRACEIAAPCRTMCLGKYITPHCFSWMSMDSLGRSWMVQLVPKAGLEPARIAPLPPQDSVSTSSTTSAIVSISPALNAYAPDETRLQTLASLPESGVLYPMPGIRYK